MAKTVYYVTCRCGEEGKGSCVSVENGDVLNVYVFDLGRTADQVEAGLKSLSDVCLMAKENSDIILDIDMIHESFKKGYVKKWSYNGWRTIKGKRVSYQLLWGEVFDYLKKKGLNLKLMKKNRKEEDPYYLKAVELLE